MWAVFGAGMLFASSMWFIFGRVLGEQSGSSPSSGSTSRIKTISDDLTTKQMGATSSGTWGDWGMMWNRIYSSSVKNYREVNGTGYGSADCTTTFALNCYTKAKGGVDDYNNNNTTPADAYNVTWTICNSGNNYCGTGRSVAEKQDPNTGLVWSPRISASSTWFTANNCKYPNGLPGDDGVCDTNGEVACYCVKLTSSKTGCEAYDDGNWRLPYQKELMQSYIDGSWANLTNATNFYWSSTTLSSGTQFSWGTYQYRGGSGNDNKTDSTVSVRCVR